MANPEIPNNNNYIDALKLKRFQFRINDVRNNLRKLLENSLAQNCDLSFLRGIENNLVTDESNPTISTLATLEVLGLRQDVFRYLSQSTNSDEYTIFNLVANEWIELAPLNKGFSFTSSNLQNTISFTRNALGELNTNKAIDYLLKRSGSRFETEISDIEIDLEDEALFLLGILSSLGINIIHIDDVSRLSNLSLDDLNQKVIEYLFETSLTNKKAVRTFLEGQDAYIFDTDRGDYKIILIREGNKCRIGYSINIRGAYFEKPNQLAEQPALPFIETETAKNLLNEFSRVGLVFNEEIEKIIIEVNESDRYGSVITHITREIAKIVNNKQRSIQELFSNDSEILSRINLLDESLIKDKTAYIIISMLKNLVNRELGFDDLVATEKSVSMRDGSCFDSVGYFEQAQDYGKLELVLVRGKRLLYKSHGAKTYMNLDPLMFNGVKIPPGGLFIKPENSQYNEFALVRLTPYVDMQSDALYGPFAPEITKAKFNDVDRSSRLGNSREVLTDFFKIYK